MLDLDKLAKEAADENKLTAETRVRCMMKDHAVDIETAGKTVERETAFYLKRQKALEENFARTMTGLKEAATPSAVSSIVEEFYSIRTKIKQGVMGAGMGN